MSKARRSVWSRRGRILGATVLMATGLASMGWATIAPIAGAIVARGSFVVDGEHQKVQYRDGGRIAKIHVALGDRVEAGQVLVSFDVPELQIRRRQYIEMQQSLRKKAAFNADELKGVRKLYEGGYVSKQRYLALERERVEVEGALQDARLKMQETEVLIEAATLRSPGTGRVVELVHTTPGGVVRPGDKIMDLLPDGAKLLVDARVEPQQIDDVKAGTGVEVRLSGLNQKTTPTVRGTVTYVAPDALTDERTQARYFQVRVALSPDDIARYQLGAGMPAEIMIETGKRSVLEYALKPLGDTFARSLREPL